MVFGNDLSQKQRVQHCPYKLHFACESAVGANVKRKNIEHQAVRDINVDLVCFDHGVVGVGDSYKDVSGEHFVIGFQQPEPSVSVLFAPYLRKSVVIVTRHDNVDVIIPGNKAAVSERTDKTAADKIEAEVVFFAKISEINDHVKLL